MAKKRQRRFHTNPAMTADHNNNAAPPPPPPSSSRPTPQRPHDSSSHAARQTAAEWKKRRQDSAWSQGRSPRRQRGAAGRASQDSSTLTLEQARSTLDLPTVIQYPHLKPLLEELKQSPTSKVHDFLSRNGIPSQRSCVPVRGGFEATVTCELPGDVPILSGKGRGNSTKAAVAAAHLVLIAAMHSNGIFTKDMASLKIDHVDAETMKEEAGATIQIYDYAARFNLIPQISTEVVQPHGRIRSSRKEVQVTVALPQQDILVSARGLNLKQVEVAAALKFKDAAEKYYAQHGHENLSVRDATALHSGNAPQFFDFLRQSNTGRKFQVILEPGGEITTQSGKNQRWQAQMTILPRTKLEEPHPLGPPVYMFAKKSAETLAYLVGAIDLLDREPELLASFQSSISTTTGKLLKVIRPVNLAFEYEATEAMTRTLRQARAAGLADQREELEAEERQVRRGYTRREYTYERLSGRSKLLLERHNRFQSDPAHDKLRSARDGLPMQQRAKQVLDIVNGNQYSIIIGATGSGKTTQVPQILLDHAVKAKVGANCNVICTQPRRIAATSVARRVAAERAEPIRDTVGYHVRFDPQRAESMGSINYCTTGILLQQLQTSPDVTLDEVSHIIIDEVHERDVPVDFLMTVLRNAVRRRLAANKPVPKVVLMSATIDPELFSNYFQNIDANGNLTPCPALHVPGRTFPVKEMYLGDVMNDLDKSGAGAWLKKAMFDDKNTKEYMQYEQQYAKMAARANGEGEDEQDDPVIEWKRERRATVEGEIATDKEETLVPVALAAATIGHICKTTEDGAILVFFPGLDEMRLTRELLEQKRPLGLNFNDTNSFRIHMLHSSVPADEQALVFSPVPPQCRKIILSTNIAETSVTIPDIQYVVDTGKVREMRYNQMTRISKLQCTWVSKANAKQRAGRAGRVQNGNYWALYTKPRFNSLRAVGLPEILRADLQGICLDVKAQDLQMPIRDFLGQAIEPPSSIAVDSSVKNLEALQALTEDEGLTALGRLLSRLPLHPSLGKMIILGVIFRCLDPMIVLGAALEERSLFVRPLEKRAEADMAHKKYLRGTGSDHLAMLNAFNEMRDVNLSYGHGGMMSHGFKNYLHGGGWRNINMTAREIEKILVDAGLCPSVPESRRFEGEWGHPTLNKNSNNIELVKALAVSGLYPNLALSEGFSPYSFRCAAESAVKVHPSSFNFFRYSKKAPPAGVEYLKGSLLTFTSLANTADGKDLTLRGTSVVTPLMAFLFGGKFSRENNIITMDKWLPFFVKGSVNEVKILVEFRKALDRLLVRSFRDLGGAREISGARPSHDQDAGLIGDDEGDRIAARRNGQSSGGVWRPNQGFADDKVRTIFATGLADVLQYASSNTETPNDSTFDSQLDSASEDW